MTKVLVLYYSSYGHLEQMADAVAAGAREGGALVDIRRVPETAPKQVVESAHFKTDTSHEVIEGPDVLTRYDAIIVGSPTRYGRVSSQMAAFWDTTGGLWASDALVGKLGAAFTSTGSQHGGQESTCLAILTNLLHMGMTVTGLDYGYKGQLTTDAVHGGTPYGASTIAGGKGERQPTEVELDGARYLGRKVAVAAGKLAA